MSRAFEAYYKAGKVMAQAYIDEGASGGNLTMASFDAAAEAIYSKVNPLLEQVQLNLDHAQELQHEATHFSKNFAITGACVVLLLLFT